MPLDIQIFKKTFLYFLCMSESAKTIIKFFCDRFLDIDYYPTNLKSILDLPIDSLKNIPKDIIAKFQGAEIKFLRDLTGIDVNKIQKFSKKTEIPPDILYNSLIAANLIANAWSKRTVYLKKPQMKVVVAGLDFAGKTSLINRLISNQTYRDMANLEPTKGANIEEFQTDRLSLVVWDLGGQKSHIEEYLNEPERFFIHIDVLLFVFDTQDDRRYDEAVNYLSGIIKILDFLDESPYILLLLNKVDADIVADPDFQIKLEYLTEKVTDIFLQSEKQWTFEITPTSIFNFHSDEPEFAKSIKNIFSKETETPKDKSLISIEEKIQTLMDINLNLLDRVVSELAEIKRVVSRLVPAEVSKGLFSVPFERVASDFVSPEIKKKKEKEKREKNEKEESVKKKNKPGKEGGVPERLEVLPGEESLLKVKDKKKKKEEKPEIRKKDVSLSKTQVITSEAKVEFAHLKPPPPPSALPPTPKAKDIPSFKPTRMEIISELKEMFIKRGISR